MSPAQRKIARHFAAILAIVYEEDRKDDGKPDPHNHVIGVDTFWSLMYDHYGSMRDVMRLSRLDKDKKSAEQIRDEISAAVDAVMTARGGTCAYSEQNGMSIRDGIGISSSSRRG